MEGDFRSTSSSDSAMEEQDDDIGDNYFMESDVDSDQDDEQGTAEQDIPENRHIPGRFLWGWQVNRQRALNNNTELIDHLVKTQSIWKPEVAIAMKTCSRGAFVPGGVQAHPEAYLDAPMHISGYGFNISAPHMHATCLQALDLKPGQRVLDVGSGSGILSAYAAIMVGKGGCVVGVDCLPKAVKLAAHNVQSQLQNNKNFSEKAAPCTFQALNVFLPAVLQLGQFDRIVVGASCPPDKLEWLTSLLKPEGGLLVTPIIPCKLCKVTVQPGGSKTSTVISQVRFSNLEIPREISIFRAFIEQDRQTSLKPPELQSTFASDVAAIREGLGSPLASNSSHSDQTTFTSRASQEASAATSSWPYSLAKLFGTCSYSEGQTEMDGMRVEDADKAHAGLDISYLGPFDCTLCGSDWTLQAHKYVLRHRSGLIRAQSNSGMRDAEAREIHVPEDFSKEAVDMFLSYCYSDQLQGADSTEAVVSSLAVAVYYCAPHMVQLCERALASYLDQDINLRRPSEETVKLAGNLLAIADESDLPHLRVKALDFITRNFKEVSKTAAYQALNKRQTGLISAFACKQLQNVRCLMDKMEDVKTSRC